MILDCHMHIIEGSGDRTEFTRGLRAAGVDGGILTSRPPACFPELGKPVPTAERLDELLLWCETAANLFPFHWIDPLEEGALQQVAEAVERGVTGFKVICDRYRPGDERAMRTYRAIARAGRPILFHSGILWDGKPSSVYNRPVEFEALLEVEGLKFALAHISWPWCDELIAVYGKFLDARGKHCDPSVEMFVDTTPGTPVIYRREALTKLFGAGYDVGRNVMFGTDARATSYSVDWVRQWVGRDMEVLGELGLARETIEGVFAGNLQRFVGTR